MRARAKVPSYASSPSMQLDAKQVISFIPRYLAIVFTFLPLLVAFPLLYLSPPFYYQLCRLALQSLGPCFIKLAQWASTRRDIVPIALCKELSKLNSSAPTHSLSHTMSILEADLPGSPFAIFSRFDSTPIASGAIAQVYRATVASDPPRDVVVKVVHPHISYMIHRDLYILKSIVVLLQQVLGISSLGLQRNVDSFQKHMVAQCNLYNEARNLEIFAANFQSSKNIRFPSPVLSLCTERVLVESYEPGVAVSQASLEEYSPQLRRDLAGVGIDAYLKMILVDNFIHSDLHPGNILIDEGDATRSPAIVMLDCGLTSTLSAKDKANFRALMEAVISGKGKHAGELMIADQTHLTEEEREGFCEGVAEMVAFVDAKPISQVEIGAVFGRILDLARIYHVYLESNFTTLVIGSIVLEGLGRQLDPNINIIQRSRPFLYTDRALVTAYLKSSLNRKLF